MKKIVYAGIFAAAAIVLSIVENMLPSFGFMQGAKLGLANIVTMVTIAILSPVHAFFVVLVRTFVTALLTGTFSAYPFSLAGGMAAFLIMTVFYKTLYGKLSFAGISVLGAVAHSSVQVMVAAIITGTPNLQIYLAFLILVSSLTGFFTGISANLIIPKLKKLKVMV